MWYGNFNILYFEKTGAGISLIWVNQNIYLKFDIISQIKSKYGPFFEIYGDTAQKNTFMPALWMIFLKSGIEIGKSKRWKMGVYPRIRYDIISQIIVEIKICT